MNIHQRIGLLLIIMTVGMKIADPNGGLGLVLLIAIAMFLIPDLDNKVKK